VAELTRGFCLDSLLLRAACSASRSHDCASVSQNGLSLSFDSVCAIRKQSCALLR